MAARKYDVVIIGAGAAGLAAAAELGRRRRSVLVLEARERLGGRCHTVRAPGLPVPIELGAEFIHGRPRATLSLLHDAGFAAIDVPRRRWRSEHGKLVPRGDFLRDITAAMKMSTALRGRDMSFEAFVDRALKPVLPPEACAFARTLVQGYDAADPQRASARAIVEEWVGESASDALARPLGGYGVIIEHLEGVLAARDVVIAPGSVVDAVEWQRGHVRVKARANEEPIEAAAARAIVTLPLGVMQCRAGASGAVRFSPALPADKRRALRQLGAGPVIKVTLQFRAAFWETLAHGRYRDASFFHAPDAPFPTLWTALPVRVPLLVAWAGGPYAARLGNATASTLTRQALRSVERIFGTRELRAQLVAAHVHDWQRDAYARGAYSHVRVGGADARRILARTIERTLYFAGEATDSSGQAGTVAGALASGVRAARELVAR